MTTKTIPTDDQIAAARKAATDLMDPSCAWYSDSTDDVCGVGQRADGTWVAVELPMGEDVEDVEQRYEGEGVFGILWRMGDDYEDVADLTSNMLVGDGSMADALRQQWTDEAIADGTLMVTDDGLKIRGIDGVIDMSPDLDDGVSTDDVLSVVPWAVQSWAFTHPPLTHNGLIDPIKKMFA